MAIPLTTEHLASVTEHTQATITSLFAFLTTQGQGDYLGEKVTQLEHSLQCAHLATQSSKYGSDPEVILAALLHDVGRLIPAAEKMGKMITPDGQYIGQQSHEILGESYLRQIGFSEKICLLVGAHVMAKRYLVATDQSYYDGLSETSKQTFKFQGGGFTAEEVQEAQKDPLLEAKLAVRRWDDQEKVLNIAVPPLEAYEEMAYDCLLEDSRSKFTLHSKEYSLPTRPTVVICVDGFDPQYLDSGIQRGVLPTFKKFVDNEFEAIAKSCMPSFTNPNNVSIITRAPPSVYGIAGNFFLDRETGKETMITDDTLLRGSTLLEQMHKRGAVCFSAQQAADCTMDENGIENVEKWIGRPAPSQYSGDLSLFVLDARIKLLEEGRSDFLYLTLSDYVQHKHAPGEKEADDFMKSIDDRLAKLGTLAPVVGVTGDHGMSRNSDAEGEPNVLFLEDALNAHFGPAASRVICPITDPFVRHHGALGSFAFPEVEIALSGEDAAKEYEMPLDREGDIVVISTPNTVIGSRESDHDLSSVRDHPLRSHGGLSEQNILVILSTLVTNCKAALEKS
ncbi:Alkaline phosphatase-like alpha/beta/alpha [Penicillium sp. IBT 16267x]|nr:Alkaline phosphatase-like alpha/beta/alpha [Penicillium sp. IBT 16267x]